MARIRSIKPEFWTDGSNVLLSDSCALFFIGLWNFCDDEGKHTFHLPQLCAELGGRWRKDKVSLFLLCLAKSGQIRLSADMEWIQVTGWSHQKIDKPRQPYVKAEDIQWLDWANSAIALDHSRPINARIGSDRKDRIGKDLSIGGKTDEVKAEKEKPVKAPPNMVFDFESIYANYPKRSGDSKKKTGFDYLTKKITSQELFEDALKAVQNYRTHCDAEGKTGTTYVKQFSTFFGSDETWREYINYTPPLVKHVNKNQKPTSAPPAHERVENLDERFGGLS